MDVIFIVLISFFYVSAARNISISTQLGPIRGIAQNNYYEFRGIPYTQFPPTGSFRFRQSEQRVDQFTGDESEYDATYFRSDCLQPNMLTQSSEDWLSFEISIHKTLIKSINTNKYKTQFIFKYLHTKCKYNLPTIAYLMYVS